METGGPSETTALPMTRLPTNVPKIEFLMTKKALGLAVNDWPAAIMTDWVSIPRLLPAEGVLQGARLGETLKTVAVGLSVDESVGCDDSVLDLTTTPEEPRDMCVSDTVTVVSRDITDVVIVDTSGLLDETIVHRRLC